MPRMTPTADVSAAAARIVADLMPIALTIAGTSADAFAGAFAEAGAEAEIFAPGATGFDLAVLLVEPGQSPGSAAAAVASLADASDRILLANWPLGAAAVHDLNGWFELFAENGYQPVVEYDASFLGQGAFLVDRNAIAAEAELAGFFDRVAIGGALAASTQRVAALEAELGDSGDRARLKDDLARRDAALAAGQSALQKATEAAAEWQARATAAEAEAATLRDHLNAWHTVGSWAAACVAAAGRDTVAALREARGTKPRRGIFDRLRGRIAAPSAAERALVEDAALVRRSPLFDAAWYIASQPDLARSGGDPVWHYLLHGAAAGADPGPWFDTQAYRAAHPGLTSAPLVHAIRSGQADGIVQGRQEESASF
jgi:hypothetical protein